MNHFFQEPANAIQSFSSSKHPTVSRIIPVLEFLQQSWGNMAKLSRFMEVSDTIQNFFFLFFKINDDGGHLSHTIDDVSHAHAWLVPCIFFIYYFFHPPTLLFSPPVPIFHMMPAMNSHGWHFFFFFFFYFYFFEY